MDIFNSPSSDVDAGVNFYELRTRLADLGFNEPTVVDQLREIVLKNDIGVPEIGLVKHVDHDYAYFTLFFGRDNRGRYELSSIYCGMDRLNYPVTHVVRFFQPDVPAAEAATLMQLEREQLSVAPDNLIPLNRAETHKQIYLLQTNNIMNTQNLEFLKKSLLNLGFGEQVNAELEKNIGDKVPEFTLAAKHDFNQQKVDYHLHFKAGDNQDMYFLNKFDTTLAKGKEQEQNQMFYINKGNGITAKEAFNLMEGRAVHKQLYNKEGEKYQAWLQLDNTNVGQNGNREIKKFTENYGFDLEQVLSGKGIKEMDTAEGKENLFRSLRKGNPQQITVERNGEDKKYFIAASPQFKTVDLYDHQMKKIKREELLNPEQKQSKKQNQGQHQKEELQGKKRSHKSKMTV